MDPRVSRMVELVTWYCADANLGYDQRNRWDFPAVGDTVTPGECDCSSLVYHCAELAGFNVPKSGTRYTGTMRRDFTKAGFEWIPYTGTDWETGDILYKEGHTAIWTGKYIAEAYGDEAGGSWGGKTGDQGQETRLSPRRPGWLGVFRWPTPIEPTIWPKEVEPMPAGEAIDYIIEEGGNDAAHASDQPVYMVRWRKWASGLMEAWVSDWYNGGNGSKYEGQWYLTKVMNLPEGFIEPPVVTVQARASRGWVSCQVHTITAAKIGFWTFGTAKNLPKFYVDAYACGVWK